MRVKHICEGHYYIISNKSVALNPLFKDIEDCKRFIGLVDYYLSKVCKVHAYSIHEDQYQILVQMADRKAFVDFYMEKHKGVIENTEIPNSSYILSQEMANLQSSTAKYFNYKNKRTGALFGNRFQKYLIHKKNDVQKWVKRMNDNLRHYIYELRWSYKGEKIGDKGMWFICSWVHYFRCGADIEKRGPYKLSLINDKQLQGRFSKHFNGDLSRKEILNYLRIRHKIPLPPPI